MDAVTSVLRLPAIVHDLDGRAVRISVEARAELLRLAQAEAGYAYQAGTDPMYFNWWDDVRDVRTPLADWVRAFEARRGAA